MTMKVHPNSYDGVDAMTKIPKVKFNDILNPPELDINTSPVTVSQTAGPLARLAFDDPDSIETIKLLLVQRAYHDIVLVIANDDLEDFFFDSWAYFLEGKESNRFVQQLIDFRRLSFLYLRSLFARLSSSDWDFDDEVVEAVTDSVICAFMETGLQHIEIMLPKKDKSLMHYENASEPVALSTSIQHPSPSLDSLDWRALFYDQPLAPKSGFDLPDIPMRPQRSRENMDGPHARIASAIDLAVKLASNFAREYPPEVLDLNKICKPETPFLRDGFVEDFRSCSLDFRLPGSYPILEVEDEDRPGSELRITGPMTICFGEKLRARHQLFIGPTGAGKTTTCTLSRLASDISISDQIVVVLDSKGGELLPYVRELTEKFRPGSRVIEVDFLTPDRSMAWNPLASLKTHADFLAFSDRFCHATEIRSTSHDSQFWIQSSIQFLSAILWVLREDPNENCTLARAREITDLPLSELKAWAKKYSKVPGLQTMVDFLDSGSHNAFTIAMDLRNRLSLFVDHRIAEVTSGDEVDFRQILTSPSVVVLRVNEIHAGRLKPLTNAFFSELCTSIFELAENSQGGKLPFPLSMIIEEFASAVGRIPDFGTILNVVRAKRVSVCASVQSIGQIEGEYGAEADSVLVGFGTKVFFPGLSLNDADYASRLFGTASVEFREKRVVKDSWESYSSDVSESESVKVVKRPILSSQEIRRPVSCSGLVGPVTFDIPDIPPFQAFLTPAYDLKWFSKICKSVSQQNKLGLERSVDRARIEVRKVEITDLPSTLPNGCTDTSLLSDEIVESKLAEVKKLIGWDYTDGSARKWWNAFELENAVRKKLVFRLAEELRNRNATITEFFMAYAFSNTDNIQANLHYLDYTRLKKEEEAKKRKAAEVLHAKKASESPEEKR
jgi:hypothetical protein